VGFAVDDAHRQLGGIGATQQPGVALGFLAVKRRFTRAAAAYRYGSRRSLALAFGESGPCRAGMSAIRSASSIRRVWLVRSPWPLVSFAEVFRLFRQ
jgi:hypothetical protein